jgi:hypothetical protein
MQFCVDPVMLFAVPPALFVSFFFVTMALCVIVTALFFLGVVVVLEDGRPLVIYTPQGIREGVPKGKICVSRVDVCRCLVAVNIIHRKFWGSEIHGLHRKYRCSEIHGNFWCSE